MGFARVVAAIFSGAFAAIGPRMRRHDSAAAPTPADGDEKNDLDPTIWAVLENADRYELISVDPNGLRGEDTAPAEMTFASCAHIEGFRVLGTLPISDRSTQLALNQAFAEAIDAWPHMHAGCYFKPRHALRAMRGDVAIDVLIWFHCGVARVLRDGERVGTVHIDFVAPSIFNDLLKNAGIPQDKDT